MNPEHPDDLDWIALARYFAGEASPEERLALESWIAADPTRAAHVANLLALWEQAGSLSPSWDAERALRRIKSGRALRGQILRLHTLAPVQAARRARVVRVGLRVAAALVLLAGASTAWWAISRPATAPEMSEVATRRGQLATVRLSDGTEVVLAPASRLRFPKQYGGRRRDVYLDGAGMFTVTHDPRRPFLVHTANAIATDLGTRFAVQAYAGDPDVRVVVAEGAVALAPAVASGDSLVLRPRDLGRVTTAGTLHAEHGVPVEAYTGWVDGRLTFRDAPLAEVVAQLGRWYDLDITIADSALGGRRLTAAFGGESADRILQVIALTLELRPERSGRSVTLYSAPQATPRSDPRVR
jgi:ferric-dicitrate binding protein FerR (iron transport regulator)